MYFGTVSSSGVLMYSKVRSFLKKQPNIMTQYKSIKTVNTTVMLSGNHLIYAKEHFAKQFDPM